MLNYRKNKTMKYISKIMIVATAVVALGGTTSCSDSFLEEDSGHMLTDGLLETGDGALAMAAGLYANLRWHFGYEWAYGIVPRAVPAFAGFRGVPVPASSPA